MLRREDMLLEFMDRRLQQQWNLLGRTVGDAFLSTRFTGDIPYPSLTIEGTFFGHTVRQTIRLGAKRMRFGGKRWFFVCPATGRPCYKLILPPGGKAFASNKAWGLPHRSQRQDAITRARTAIAKLSRRSAALPKHTRSQARKRLQERLERHEAFLDRVEVHCASDLTYGRRISLRRAARLATVQRHPRDPLEYRTSEQIIGEHLW